MHRTVGLPMVGCNVHYLGAHERWSPFASWKHLGRSFPTLVQSLLLMFVNEVQLLIRAQGMFC